MEGGAIVEAFAGAGDEFVDVLWRFSGSKFEAEDAEAGGDDGFEFGGRLGEGGEQENGGKEREAHRHYVTPSARVL